MPNCKHSAFNRFRDECGYTIVELLVAMQITLLVTAFAFAGYHFAVKMKVSWQEKKELNSAVTQLSQAITKDIQTARRVLSGSASYLELETLNNKSVVYEVSRKDIIRNKLNLLPGDMSLKDFTFSYYRKEKDAFGILSSSDKWEKFSPLQETNALDVELVKYEGKLIYKNRAVKIQSTIAMRPDRTLIFNQKQNSLF